MDQKIDVYFNVALDLVKSAGDLITQHSIGCNLFETKSSEVDLVTEFDKKVEETIISGLSEKFPNHKIIGEESISGGKKCELTDDPTWVLDPIDGTLNFVHGYPHTGISLALLINKEPVAGIVYNPILNQLYTARKGKGAFLNDKPINVSQVKELSRALVVMEMYTNRNEKKYKYVRENFKTIIETAHGIRTWDLLL